MSLKTKALFNTMKTLILGIRSNFKKCSWNKKFYLETISLMTIIKSVHSIKMNREFSMMMMNQFTSILKVTINKEVDLQGLFNNRPSLDRSCVIQIKLKNKKIIQTNT